LPVSLIANAVDGKVITIFAKQPDEARSSDESLREKRSSRGA